MIYGVSFGDATTLADLNAPVNRYGGNNTSRYNWQLNADNRGQDWYFESIAENSAVAGERGDTFFSMSKNAGAQAMITIPMIGWVAKLGPNRGKLASFSIAKYGAQADADWQWFPDAGNGVRTNGQNVTGNDPNDATVPVDSTFQQNWIYHMVSKWGTAANGGVKYYILDNEHSIWFSTHRDVFPTGPHASDIRDRMIDYAGRIKSADPSALVVGPEEWGWSGYVLSGYDQQYGAQNGWSNLPDRTQVLNGMDYLPWLLSQWKGAGLKPVDVFSVHYYPQGGEFGNDTSTAMQQRRNRSTRSLWDPNYVDETWIADKVQLIPRLKQWVQSYYYTGTPTAITEYNWGAESHINGATTQADVYGIFGREGLDIATRWTTPSSSTPTYKAMKMYRNYDGARSGFGDTSVKATVPNPDSLSAFAAVRSSDGALTVMVVNKVTTASPVNLSLAGFSAGATAQAWQLTSANAIARIADVAVASSALNTTVPAQSVTLFVIPAGNGSTNHPPTASFTATPVTGTAPLAVSFDASASSDSDGSIASYAWTFGDGATGSGKTASHTYTTASTYTATLTVTDNQGATGTATKTITVNAATNHPPTAWFTATPTTGTAPLAVSFDASASSDSDGSIASYAWTFGDGGTGSGKTASHSYTTAGTFTATLTVTDNQGATGTTTRTITVTGATNRPPTASFTATPVTGTAPLAVSFDASASSDSDGSIASYAWTFGDGAAGSGKTLAHTYSTAGTYTAKLTVKDNQGATATATKTITVSAPPTGGSTCAVKYSITNDWGNGFQAAVTITNLTSKAINNWSLTFSFPGNQKVTDYWWSIASQSGKNVTLKNQFWNPTIAAGGSTSNVGFNANYSGTNAKPTAFALNGKACVVK